MIVRVYVDGHADSAVEYPNLPPQSAALEYAAEHMIGPGVVVVEPVDDESKSLESWVSDDAGPFCSYHVKPPTAWILTHVGWRKRGGGM